MWGYIDVVVMGATFWPTRYISQRLSLSFRPWSCTLARRSCVQFRMLFKRILTVSFAWALLDVFAIVICSIVGLFGGVLETNRRQRRHKS